MALRSPLLAAAGVLLAATAAFHLTGLPEVSSWLNGVPGRIVALLWASVAVGWLIIAFFWLYHAFADALPGWPAIIATALIPLVVAFPLLAVVNSLHPGGYMLTLSALLAICGRRRMN